MERKTTQRIIGILVVAALIVISLPLLMGGNSPQAPIQTAEQKAPPFPDEAIHQTTPPVTTTVTQVEPNGSTTPATEPQTLSVNMPEATQGISSNNQTDLTSTQQVQSVVPSLESQPTHPESAQADQSTDQLSQAVVASTASSVIVNKDDSISLTAQSQTDKPNVAETIEKPVIPVSAPPKVEAVNAVKTVEASRPLKVKHVKMAHKKLTHPIHNEILQHNDSAWVVQMGSFKNKLNAERLTNSLRAKGYKAFTREVKNDYGTRVRVYVGPEFKMATAKTLVDKIQNDLNLQGIVVYFKPLEI